jgi:integrase
MHKTFTTMTRRPTTIRAYFKRTEQLRIQVRKKKQMPSGSLVDPRLLVGWLIQRRTGYSASTWRQYKSAVLCALENELDMLDKRLEPAPWVEAIETLKKEDGNGDGAKGGKTSSMKLKRFPASDFETLDAYLKSHTHPIHEALRDWLRAGMWTGLRPVEWRDAQWIDIKGVPALLVQNAKHSNGRAHGKTRTVVLHRCSKEELAVIKRHLDRVLLWDAAGAFSRMYQSCINKMYLAVRRVWPKRTRHLTLYSTRHQFVADAKASNLSLVEIAALMGHAVDDTATEYYGKRAAGQQILKVQAIAEEVARIKQVFQGHPDRRLDQDPPKMGQRASAASTSLAPPA